jgi:hypothetical protein
VTTIGAIALVVIPNLLLLLKPRPGKFQTNYPRQISRKRYTPPPEDLDFREAPKKYSPALKSATSGDELFGEPPAKAKLSGE